MSTQATPGADDELWVRRFHPAPDKPVRLVFLPHAGGSAPFFFPFSKALAEHADVLTIQYPGRQDRRAEPPVETTTGLADHIFEALRPWADRPLVFFGHSMGAVISFELARKFERAGSPVRGLIASGRRSPTVHREENVHTRGDDGIIKEIRALSGTDAGILADEELLRMVLPAIRADYKAIETYRYQPDDGTNPPLTAPLSVLTGESDPRVSLADAKAWQELTSGAFSFRTFPGGHFFLTPRQDDVVRAVVEDLAAFADAPVN